MKRLDEMKPDFEDCDRRINRLRQIETELAGLSTRGFEAHVGFIKPLLRDPLALEEVEGKFNELKAEIEKGVTAPRPPGIVFDEGKSISSTGDQLLGRKEYKGAIKAYEDALKHFNQMAQDARSIGPQFETSVKNAMARAKANIATCQIGVGQQLLDSAGRQFAGKDYGDATKTYEGAKSRFQAASNMASESGDTRSANNARGLLKETSRRIEECNAALAQAAKPPARPVSDAPPVLLPEGYHLVGKRGRLTGAFADVYRTINTQTGAVVALKIPRWAGSQGDTMPGEVNKFIKEAELWQAVNKTNHPNIVRIHEYGAEPYPWIAMEYMEAGSLRQRIGKLSVKEAVDIGTSLAGALYNAHHIGIVHQDIKPENILFDEDNNPKLSDWGLGKMMVELLSHSAAVSTPSYSAPEQIAPKKFGKSGWWTDIYQCGVVIYEMVTGQLPFGGQSPAEVMYSILEEEPSRPSEVNSQVPPELDDIILKAMAKEPKERYRDIAILEDALDKIRRQLLT